MRKVVGKVTEEEKCEIQQLFERQNGLNELAKIGLVESYGGVLSMGEWGRCSLGN